MIPADHHVQPLPAPITGVWRTGGRGELWRSAGLLIAALVAAPIGVVLAAWLTPAGEVWRHLAHTVLLHLVRNTIVLMLGVGIGVLVLGVGLAWLTAMCDFPGRSLFGWALILPLVVPGYVLAFVAVSLLDFSGPVQGWLRAIFGPGGYWFPPIRSEGGVISVLVLVFYPYVYMLARASFLSQGRAMLEVGRVLGLGPAAAFLRVSLPMARPAIAAGVALALMETLADFGTVAVFNYDTFTTAIYEAWFGLFNLTAAAQLASLLLLFVALALYAERRWRGRARYHVGGGATQYQRFGLTGWRRFGATALCAIVLAASFLIPVSRLGLWVWTTAIRDVDARYLGFLVHTLTLGATAALLTVGGALLLAYVRKTWPDRGTRAIVRLGTLGYALPGAVLAVGIMRIAVGVDHRIAAIAQHWFGVSPGLLLSGTLGALIFAYVVRFLAAAYGPVDSSLEGIRPSLQDAARTLGAGGREILWRIYLPLLRPGLLTAALLVLIDVMKEMPATLMLRPFGWDTLAIRIFEMTSEGEWERAALPALTLVLAGMIPVMLLVRRTAASPAGDTTRTGPP